MAKVPYSVLPGTPYPPKYMTNGLGGRGGLMVTCLEAPPLSDGDSIVLVSVTGESFQTTCMPLGANLVLADPLPMSLPLGSHLLRVEDITPDMAQAWEVDLQRQEAIALDDGGDVEDDSDPTEGSAVGVDGSVSEGDRRNHTRRRSSDG
jgi:hypothetical protein